MAKKRVHKVAPGLKRKPTITTGHHKINSISTSRTSTKGYAKRHKFKRVASAPKGSIIKKTSLSGRQSLNHSRSGKVHAASHTKHRDRRRDSRGRFI